MSFLKNAISNTLMISNLVSPENTEMNDVNIIAGEGDDIVVANGNNNNVDLGTDNDIVYLSGNNNDVKGSEGDKLSYVNGNNNVLEYTGDGTHETYITGNNNSYSAETGTSVGVISGDNNKYAVGNGDYQLLNVEGNTNFVDMGGVVDSRYIKVNGDSNSISAKDGNTAAEIEGNSNSVTSGDGSNAYIIKGDSNKISGGNGSTQCADVEGNNNSINVGSGSTAIAVKGNSNTFNGGDGEAHVIELEGNSNSVSVGAGSSSSKIKGDSNSVNGGDGEAHSIEVEGNSNSVAVGAGSSNSKIKGDSNSVKVGDGEGHSSEITGNSNSLEVGDGATSITVTGDSNSVKGGDAETHYAEIKGNSNNYAVGDGEAYAKINGNSNSAEFGDGSKTVYLTGDKNTLKTGDGETYSEIKGNSNDITMGDGDKTIIMNGNSNKMSVGDGDTYMRFQGNNNDLKFGDGNNTVGFIGNKNNIEFGDGNNYVAIWGDSNRIKAGNGDNYIESLDRALQSGKFTELYNAWFSSLPTSTWSTTSLIDVDVKKKTKSKCGGLKKKTTITTTYTYQVDTYKRYHVNGPSNTTIELGNGNNTVAITGGAKVTAGKNTKVQKCAKWCWDELIDTYTYQVKTKKTKTSWNWSGVIGTVLTGGLLPLASALGDAIDTGIFGKPITSRLIGDAIGLVSKKAGNDYKLFAEGARQNKFIQYANTAAVIIGGTIATIFTAGAAAPAVAGAVTAVTAGAVAGTAATVAGTAIAAGVAGSVASMASATAMSGMAGQQISGRALAAAGTAGLVGGIAGGATAAGVGAIVGTSTAAGIATTAASAGFVGGLTGSATSQLVMNNGFDSKEMWTSAGIGAASGLAMAAVTGGWNAGKDAFTASRYNADGTINNGFWSSLGDGIVAGGRTALNIATGGITEGVSSNVFGTTNIETTNAKNSLKVAEMNRSKALENVSKAEQDLSTMQAERDEFMSRDTGLSQEEYNTKLDEFNKNISKLESSIDTYNKQIDSYQNEIDYYNSKINSEANYAKARLDDVETERNLYTQGYDKNGNPILDGISSDRLNTLNSEVKTWENYYNQAQNGGTVDWGTRFDAYNIDNNFLTSASKATFGGTVLEAPTTIASNAIYGTGELAYNTGKGIYNVGEWAVGKTVGGVKWLGETAWRGLKGLGNLALEGAEAIGNAFKSGSDTVSKWFSSDSSANNSSTASNPQTAQNTQPASNTSSATSADSRSWWQKTTDWLKDTFTFGSNNNTNDALTQAYKDNELASEEFKAAQKALDYAKQEYEYYEGKFSSTDAIPEDVKLNLQNAQNAYDAASNKVFETGYKIDEILYNTNNTSASTVSSASSSGDNFILRGISDAGQSALNFLNDSSSTLLRNVLDFTGIKTGFELTGKAIQYFSDNKYGWNANGKLDTTISNTFTADKHYGFDAIYEFSGAKSLMGAANDAFGYLTGVKSNNTYWFGNNASKPVSYTLWSDAASVINPTTTSQGNWFQRLGNFVSRSGQNLANIVNNGGNIFRDVLGLTPVKGVVNTLGSAMKFTFGNNYGWGKNLNYTLPGIADAYNSNPSGSLSAAAKYIGNGAWDLTGAKAMYQLGDKSMLWLTNNNYSLPNTTDLLPGIQLSNVNDLNSTLATTLGSAWDKGVSIYNTGKEYLWDSWSLGSVGKGISSPVSQGVSSAASNPIALDTRTSSSAASNAIGLDTRSTTSAVSSANSSNWFTTGLNKIGSGTTYGLSAIGSGINYGASYLTNGLNTNLASVNPSYISYGSVGQLSGQAYSKLTNSKTDLSKLSVR